MTERQSKLFKYTLIGAIFLNLGMCLNLYRQVIQLEYKISKLESNTIDSMQSLSRFVWEIKSSISNTANNYSGGEFE